VKDKPESISYIANIGGIQFSVAGL